MSNFQTGDKFGNYIIQQKLGSGGMSNVYLALDTTGGQIAIKILHKLPTKENESSLRFQKEIRAVKSLSHPGIVSIIDVGEINGLQYYSMDYLGGGSLRDRIEAGISVKESINILIKLAGALGYAHAQGYIHRDIKPENILFNMLDEPVITDLGVVKSVALDTRLTQTGIGVGTPYYMSPEQARGVEDIDCRTDIYSLGIVLYEMLIGEVPFDGDSAVSIIMRHVESPIPKLPKYLSSFQFVINRMIAKKAENRYFDCTELVEALQQLLEIESYDNSISEMHNTTCINLSVNKGNKAKKAIVGLGAIILIFGVVSYFSIVKNQSEHDQEAGEILDITPNDSELAMIQQVDNRINSKTKSVKKGSVLSSSFPEKEMPEKEIQKKQASTKQESVIEEKLAGTNKISSVNKNLNAGPPILRIETIPSGAEIIINGRPFGRTPYYGREIASGDHKLLLKLDDYEIYSTRLELEQGVLTEKNISLVKAKGKLFVNSDPTGARIFLNGEYTGKVTPYLFASIEAGKYDLELRLPRYYPYIRDVSVVRGKKGELDVSLEGGDLILHDGKWISKDQKIVIILQEANSYFNGDKFGVEDGGKALDAYYKVLAIDADNQKAKAGIKKVAEKYFQHASYYCEEELFSQCFEYIQKTLDIDDTLAGVKTLRSDSILRLAWNRVLAGENSLVRDAIPEIKKQYNITDDSNTVSSADHQDRVAEIEKYIDDGNWRQALDGIIWLETKTGMESITKDLRKKYQALKDYYQNGRIIRDRLKDGTLGPRLIVVPVIASDSTNFGNDRLFLIGETEISNKEFEKFLVDIGVNITGQESRLDHPVVNITKEQADAYVDWLSDQSGEKYRLPSVQELEFAYSAGQTNISGNERICTPFLNFEDVSLGAKNKLGVIGYDRNVWEITSTCTDRSCNSFYLKGGAIEDDQNFGLGFDAVSFCRSSYKDVKRLDSQSKNIATGFRVLREMQ